MKEHAHSPLPAELHRLLDAERRAPGPSQAVKTRVWSRLEMSLGTPVDGGGAVTAHATAVTTPGLVVAGTAVVMGALVGTFLWLTTDHAPSPPTWSVIQTQKARQAPQEEAASTPIPQPATQPKVAVPVAPRPVDVRPAPAPPTAPTMRPSTVLPKPPATKTTAPRIRGKKSSKQAPVEADPNKERQLIAAARTALRSGKSGRALALLRQHQKRFTKGSLIQEREALRVRALVRAGRFSQARKRGAGFLKRFPRSLHRRAVEAALRRLEAADSKRSAKD